MDKHVIELELGAPSITRKTSNLTICKYERGTVKYEGTTAKEINLISTRELQSRKELELKQKQDAAEKEAAAMEAATSAHLKLVRSSEYITAKTAGKLAYIQGFLYTHKHPELPELRSRIDEVSYALIDAQRENQKLQARQSEASTEASAQFHEILSSKSAKEYQERNERQSELMARSAYISHQSSKSSNKLNSIEEEAKRLCAIFESTATQRELDLRLGRYNKPNQNTNKPALHRGR